MKGRKHRETGGRDDAETDIKVKPQNRSNTGEKEEGVVNEAEELKKGGRAKRKHGGRTKEGFGPEHEKTELKAGGKAPMKRMDRMPRKAGGRTGVEGQPFTDARKGEDAPGRKLMKGEYGFGEA
jgi:hypothetical protein